jgi:ABC-type Fe3+/spermidine/putrescine transport system ATPase subunit
MSDGKLVQLGLNPDVFARPCTGDVAAIVGVSNRIPARIEDASDHGATVRFCGSSVHIAGEFQRGEPVLVCLRGEDIDICHVFPEDEPVRASQVNAKIETVSPWMAQYRITMRAGDQTLTAFISKSRFAKLCLKEGDVVFASFDPADVHVIRDSSSASSGKQKEAENRCG